MGARMPLKLIVANKAYSSWSMRPWLLLAGFDIPFEDEVIALDQPDTRARIVEYSPAGKCPILIDGAIKVWDSLAIIEYVAETYPDKAIWPRVAAARAMARALAAEMHSGFTALRQHCPTQFARSPRRIALNPAVEAEVERIEAAWRQAREKYGQAGPFLFGEFSAADAMFAPVVNRLHIYEIPVGDDTRAYMDALRALPAWRAWTADAEAEPWRIAKYDAI